MSIATKQLEECLEEIESMKQLLASYEATLEIIAKMETENVAKLKEVAKKQHSVGLKIKSLQKNPQISSQQNAPLLSKLKTGLKEVILKTKNYPQPMAGAAGNNRPRGVSTKERKLGKTPDGKAPSKPEKVIIKQESNNSAENNDLPKTVEELMRKLGLEEFYPILEEASVDMELLEQCTKDNLSELGLPQSIDIKKFNILFCKIN